MELYQALPDKINSKTTKDLPVQVVERIRYLWKASFNVLNSISSNPVESAFNDAISLSHHLSKKMMQTILNHGVYLPQSYLQQLCEKCCVLQIPSLTCRSRLKRRSRKSKCNQKAKKANHDSLKIKNQLIRTCLICNHVTGTHIGCKRGSRSASLAASHSEANVMPEETPKIFNKPSAKSFSFHDIMKATDTSGQSFNIQRNDDSSSFDMIERKTEGGFGGKYLTLIEREQLNKKLKKKQKKIGDDSKNPATSLASLRNIFSSSLA